MNLPEVFHWPVDENLNLKPEKKFGACTAKDCNMNQTWEIFADFVCSKVLFDFFLKLSQQSLVSWSSTLKSLRGVNLTPPPWGFSKNVLFRERVRALLFVTFNIDNFPETYVGIYQLVQKVWRFCSSVLYIFISFSDFLTFPCCK